VEFEAIAERIRLGARLAVITGAGISAESGIPTFRGAGGFWKNFRAEDLATPEAFARNPRLVWEWYDYRRGLCAKAEPNAAHRTAAEMERAKEEFLLITQNVDGLHERAGSVQIAEIHGNIWKARCTVCGAIFEIPETPLQSIPVHCSCGKLARPHIVWFGETYDPALLQEILAFLSKTDIVIVVGTSGMVPMPVYLTRHAVEHGAFAIGVNPEVSLLDEAVHISIRGKAGDVLPELWKRVRA